MKFACIDVGTNSIRLLVADYKDGLIQNRFKKLKMTRLGYGVNETKLLDCRRMIESLNAIDGFYQEAMASGAKEVFIFATSAVRDAYNGIDFRQMVYNKTETEVEIISGSQEAMLGYRGVCAGHNSNPQDEIVVIDIGGGSTEFMIGNKVEMKDSMSLDIGSVRLTGAFIKSDPISSEDLQEVSAYIDDNLKTIKKLFKMKEALQIVGIGGTASAFVSMANKIATYDPEKLHGATVSFEKIVDLNKQLQKMTVEERKKIVGLDSRRADIIIAGGLILQEFMKLFNTKEIIASDYDNLEGYLIKKINERESLEIDE